MDSDDSTSYVGHMIIHESPDTPDISQHSRDEATNQLGVIQEVDAAADLGQDLAQDNHDSSDSAYQADTITDSPSSTSSTLQLNVSSDSSEPNEVKENSSDEDDMHMPLNLPAPAAAAAAAAAGHPMLVRNLDETGFGFKVCALHSYKHLHTACSGCVCKCEAQDIYVKIPAANVHFYYLSDSEDDDEDSSPKDM